MRDPNTHTCPGCQAPVPRWKFACYNCWFRLPPNYRETIVRTQAARDREGHRLAMAAAVRWYRSGDGQKTRHP